MEEDNYGVTAMLFLLLWAFVVYLTVQCAIAFVGLLLRGNMTLVIMSGITLALLIGAVTCILEPTQEG